MNTHDELLATIAKLTAPGKGILAADESTPTITKRFKAVGIESTDESRRQYRNLLFTTPDANQYLAGVILFEETLGQKGDDGTLLPDLLAHRGIVPGIKVDKGTVGLPGADGDLITQGLDGLGDRLTAYKSKGARFAKWREVYAITDRNPTRLGIDANAEVLARYAAICQEYGIVPIVEPEVLIDGTHTIERCHEVSEAVLHAVFHALHRHKVLLEGHGAEAEHGAARQGEPAEGGAGGRRARDARSAEADGAGGGADDQLPVGRPVAGRGDREPECDERDGAARAVDAVVLLRARAAGRRDADLGGQAGERAPGAGRVREACEDEQPRAPREVDRADGEVSAESRV